MKKWIFCLALIIVSSKIWAQGCALCSLNAKSMGQNAGIGLNHGILYLAAIPLIFIVIVGVIWFRRMRPDQED